MPNEFFYEDNKKYEHIFNNQLINGENPFPRNPVCSKENLPKFCLGRNEEIGTIKNAIEKVYSDYNQDSSWIPIMGGGGTGKTTIALYIYDSAKRKKSVDLEIDYLECSYIDCPSDPKFLNAMYLYSKILEDLGDVPGNFPYFLAYHFIKKIGSFLEENENLKEEFKNKFSMTWKEISETSDFPQLQKLLKEKYPSFSEEFRQFVLDYDYAFLSNPNFLISLDYVCTLIDLNSTETDKRRAANDELMGKNIGNEENAITMIKNLMNTIRFLFEKNCLMLIIDNLENLPTLENESFENLFRILLLFRNQIKNCLLVTIGSTDFWQAFNSKLNMSQINMINGFKYDDISLSNLSDDDASQILSRYIKEYWDGIGNKNSPVGRDSTYPFSKDSFKYLYEVKGRNLRDTIKAFNRKIEKYKQDNFVTYIRNIEDSIFYLRPTLQELYLFENEMIYLENSLQNFQNRNQLSRNIEFGLQEAFRKIKEQPIYNEIIDIISHEPIITTNRGTNAKPDIYLQLFGNESIEDIRKVEIQVKAYYPTNEVKFDDIKGSYELIKDQKTHFLTFLSLSPLSSEIIQKLSIYGPQIGRTSNLNLEEANYLLLLTRDFARLFFKNYPLDSDNYIEILDKLKIKIPEFFEKIKNIELEKVGPSPSSTESTSTEGSSAGTPPPSPPPKPPKMPGEKISNPQKLMPEIINLFNERKIFKKKDDLIDCLLEIARSKNVINNAITKLRQQNKIQYSRSEGWSLV